LTVIKSFELAQNQLCGFHNNNSNLRHLNSGFLGRLRTTLSLAGRSTSGKTIMGLCQCRKTGLKHVL